MEEKEVEGKGDEEREGECEEREIGEERKVLFLFWRVGTSWSAGLQLVPLLVCTYRSTRQQVTDLSSALQGVLLCELKDKTQYSTSIGVYLLVA